MTEASFVFFISDNAGYAYSVYPRSISHFMFHGLEYTFNIHSASRNIKLSIAL